MFVAECSGTCGNVLRECTSRMSWADAMTWQEDGRFFVRHAKLPGCPGVSGAAEFQTQTMFVMSYRTLQPTVGSGAHQHGRDACRLRGGRRSRCGCGCVVDRHHDRRGEHRPSFPSFPLTFPTMFPNVNRQPPLWAKWENTDSGGGAIPMFPRLPRVLRAKKKTPLTLPAPLVRMSSSHVAISDVRSCVPGAPFVAVLRVLASPSATPKVFIRYIDVGHGGCDSLARFSGKKFVPRVQYATHFSARRSVEHALLPTY